jgi:penicillin-binding protein 2
MDLQKFLEIEILSSKKNNARRFKVLDNFVKIENNQLIDANYSKFINIFTIVFILFMIIIFIRIFDLQIIKYIYYKDLSDRNYLRGNVIYPSRGLIFDRNKNFLVKNVPYFFIYQNVDKCINREVEVDRYKVCIEDLEVFKRFFPIDTGQIINKYFPGRIILLKKNITKNEINPFLNDLNQLKSLDIVVIPTRDYLFEESMSHVLGYVSESSNFDDKYEGKDGIELYYNDVLSGTKGFTQKKFDSQNNVLDTFSGVSPISGKNITLTIDSSLQEFIYEKLKNKVTRTKDSTGGSVVVQDPRNGQILALVNYPSYSIQKFSDGISAKDYQELLENPGKPFFNRSVSGAYPPGSVFKLVTAAGILEEKIATPTDTIFDQGYIEIKNYRYHNWKRDGHGIVDVTRAMKVSNDTYFYIYTAGFEDKKGLGVKKLYDWALKFNFSILTGIDLPGEVKGFMPDGTNKVWYLGDTFITAIGQGDVLATPIQTSLLMAYFAADQKAYKPHLVSEIDDKVRKDVILYSNLMSNENFQVVKNSLKEVNSKGGTAYSFNDMELKWGFDSGGKTGTSEFLKNGVMKTHAWYSGFAPYDNAEVVVTVFLEDGGGGSDDASPLAREIMDFYFTQKKSLLEIDTKK